MDGWNKYLKKKVYVVLISDRKYAGQVVNIDSINSPMIYMSLVDKDGKLITFPTSQIKLIQEEE